MNYTAFELRNRLAVLREICTQAVDTYGREDQLLQTAEELAELTQAISKAKRYTGQSYIDGVAEEIADVLIMITQLQVIFGITDYMIESEVERKAKRLRNLVAAEKRRKGV